LNSSNMERRFNQETRGLNIANSVKKTVSNSKEFAVGYA
jgi:hypothetical protein